MAIYFASLVPQVFRLRAEAPDQIPHFRAETLGLACLVVLPLSAAVYFGLHFIIGQAFSSSSELTLNLALTMIFPMTLVFGLGLVAAVYGAYG